MKQLEFKKYYVESFYIKKVRRNYPRAYLEASAQSDGYLSEVRDAIKKHGYAPAIIIGDRLGMWKSEFVIGSSTYHLLDTLNVDDNGEICEDGIKEYLMQMYFFNTVVGDANLILDKEVAMAKYMERMSKSSSDK